MRTAVVGMSLLLCCLALSACGPLLNCRDAVAQRPSPRVPGGAWKRDFWGRPYFEATPASAAKDSSEDGTAAPVVRGASSGSGTRNN